jgi:phosphoglycolate phosphatase
VRSTPERCSRRELDDVLVIFDWNGTVVADLDRAVAATNDMLTAYGRPLLTEHEFQERWRLPIASWLHGFGISPDDLDDAENCWNRAMAASPAPVRPEAAGVLTELVELGALLGVVSAAGAATVTADLERGGLVGYFSTTATAVADKASYLRGLRHLRPRAVYVGDTEYDLFSATAADYTGVAITGGYRSADALGATGGVVLTSLSDLPGLLTVPARRLPRLPGAHPAG